MRTPLFSAMCLLAFGLLLTTGCDPKGKPEPKKPDPGAAAHVHGPNDGELYKLGDDGYHAELLQDVHGKVVTVYILDKNQNPLPIAEETITIRMTLEDTPTSFPLTAKPREGEAPGAVSKFESTDEALIMALANQTADRAIEVTIDGKPQVATFEYYEPHHHGHAHDGHDDHGEHGEHHDAHDHEGHEHEPEQTPATGATN